MTWSEKDRKLFDEANILVPGILSAQLAGDVEGQKIMLNGFISDAAAVGLGPCHVWSILFAAANNWARKAVVELAKSSEMQPEDLLQRMSMAAAQFQANGV
jgi:hypothetical protein